MAPSIAGRLSGKVHDLLHDQGLFAAVAALCGSGDPQALSAIILALFLTGLAGGVAHCGPMCGPFVLMQLGDAGSAPRIRRLSAGLLPAYHFGRILTYSALGAAAGGLGGSLIAVSPFRDATALLLGLAALAFLLQGLKGLGAFLSLRTPFPVMSFGGGLGAFIARAIGPILRAAPGRFLGLHGLLLGLVLGLLPCGFLYAALLVAMATGHAAAGGIAMLGFGLGTVPALAAIGMIGAGVAHRWRAFARGALPPIFLINALTLGGIALHLAG